MVLHEGDRRLQTLHRLLLMLHHCSRRLCINRLFLRYLCYLWLIQRLAHNGIGTQPQRQTYDETDTHLSHNLPFTFQTVFVTTEDLDIVIEESQESQPNGSNDHQDDVNVSDTAEQQHRHEDADDDDDAAHRGNTLLLNAEGVDARIALRLEDLPALHPLDEPLTEPRGNQQRQYQRQQRTEGDIAPHVRARDIILL